jgi:hypothetical protein
MNPVSPYDSQIDATLRLFGDAQPPAGLNDRVSSRVAREWQRTSYHRATRRFPFSLRLAISGMAATACAAAVVIGTVQHSNRIVVLPPPVHMQSPGGGIGAAGAEHVSTRITPQPSEVRGRNAGRSRHGRAIVSPDAHKAPGVALPKPADQP